MKKLSFWLGVICLLYVGLGLVAGMLPVNAWSFILDLFIEREPNTFYKVIPTEGSEYQTPIITLIGLALIAYGKFKFKSTKGL